MDGWGVDGSTYTHMAAHIMCDHIQSDISFILKHANIFQCHTHICCTYRVCQCRVYTLNILKCQYIEAYVCIVHTYVTHIIRRRDYTCLYMKPETPCLHPGAMQRSDNATGSQIVINPISRILLRKSRCQQINSQFGSGLIKRLYRVF